MGRKTTKKRKLHVQRKPQATHTPDKGTYVQRTYKDSLFRFIFRDKQKLLQLYNALNGSDYQDPEELFITTLENVLYIGRKNDVSFLLENTHSLYEHQGSWNPNMPIRGVLYFARLFQDYINTGGYNLYGKKQIPLPYPQYVVFYNGTEERPEREELKLSNAFQKTPEASLTEPALECRTLVLNINYGRNQELLESCRPLMEYAYFVHCIRRNLALGYATETAVDMAVEKCLAEGILTDLLRAHRKEVTVMFLEEYDMELHYRTLREEGFEEGIEEGEKRMNVLIQRLAADNRMDDLIRSASDAEFQKQLLAEYGL